MIRSSDGRRLPVGPGDGERKGEPAVGGRQICLGAGIILGGLWVWSELRGQTPLPPWPAETVPAARPRLTQPVAATAEGVHPWALPVGAAAAASPQTPPVRGQGTGATPASPPAGQGLPLPTLPQLPASSAVTDVPTPLIPPTVESVRPAEDPSTPGKVPLAAGATPPAATTNGTSALSQGSAVNRSSVPTTPVLSPSASVSGAAEGPSSQGLSSQGPPAAGATHRSSPDAAHAALRLQVVGDTEVVVGQEYTYSLVVQNVGPDAAPGVQLEEELVAQVTYRGSEPAATVQGRRLMWNLGTIAAGGEKRVTIRVVPLQEGEWRTRPRVWVTATAEKAVRITRPRLTATIRGPETVRRGAEVLFHIAVHNSGSGTAQSLVVQAQLTDGLRHPHGPSIEAQLPPLAAGESRTVPLKVAAAGSGTQTCRLTITATGCEPVTLHAAVQVVEPRLELRWEGPARLLVRSEGTYEAVVSNTGTAASDPATLVVQVPEVFEVASVSEGGQYDAAARVVRWAMPEVAAGSSRRVGLKLRAVTAGAVPLRGQLVAEHPLRPAAAPSVTDSTALAQAEMMVRAEGVAALRFEVYDLEDPVLVGQDAVYEIRVINQGTGACQQVQVVAALPQGAEFRDAQGPTVGRWADGQVVFAALAVLPEKGEAVYRVRVRAAAAGDARIRVQLSCQQMRAPVVKEESTQFIQP